MDETRLHDKLDQIASDISMIKTTPAVNTTSLQEHMRRTALLDEAVEPINKHVAMIQGVLKLLSLVGVMVGIAAGVKAIL